MLLKFLDEERDLQGLGARWVKEGVLHHVLDEDLAAEQLRGPTSWWCRMCAYL